MKNKIGLSKKNIQIFFLFFLIIGFFIVLNFINKTVSPNQNALATYSCLDPNQEVARTSNQMCYQVCELYGGYLKQDFDALKCCCKGNGIIPTISITEIPPQLTPTPIPKPTQNPRCTFNPSKTCSPGSTWVEYNGFCGCLVNKRCMSETSQLYDTPNHYLSWIEEYKDDKWWMFQTCLYPEPICDTNTFQCVSMGPTGPKKFGEVCQTGSECQSGECDSQYTSPSGDEIILIREQCTYSLIDQGQFANKRRDNDLKLSLVASSLVVGTVTSPLMVPTLHVAAVAGLPAAANYLMLQLQEPWVQNIMATINLTSTLYAISDCTKNGTNGEWCNMLAAIAINNPGQFGLAFEDDFNTITRNLSKDLNFGKYLNLAKAAEETTSTADISLITSFSGDETITTVINYQPLNSSKTAKGPWPVGQTFPSNRGGNVVVDEMIGSGGLGDVYKATLFEPNKPPKAVVIKFPKTLSPEEIMSEVNEQFLLAQGQNSLPVNLRVNLAKPYGFATVDTAFGKAQLPLLEDFGHGQTLSNLMRSSPTDKVYLTRIQVDNLYKTARTLDDNKIFLKDIFTNNIFLANDGRLVLFDPYMPRLDPGTGRLINNTWRTFTDASLSKFALNKNLLFYSDQLQKWAYEVPISNVAALDRMFQLYNKSIIIR